MLSEKDRELVEAATETIKRRYRNDWQEVGAALRTRSAEALIDWVNADLFERLICEFTDGEHVFPVGGVAGVAFFAAVGSGIEEVRRRGFEIEVKAFVGIGWKKADGFILKNQIADAVEDRPAFINFNAQRKMRAMTDEDVGAGIDGLMGEFHHEVGAFF